MYRLNKFLLKLSLVRMVRCGQYLAVRYGADSKGWDLEKGHDLRVGQERALVKTQKMPRKRIQG